jgi:hypothetical protein
MKMRKERVAKWAGIVALVMMVMLGAGHYRAKAAQSGSGSEGNGQPFVIEYYYKAKWGHADEFLALFKKNHYPVLKKEIELGRMLKVSMAAPRYHTTEDGRWDFRVTIVPLIKQLFPDQELYKKEEQRRFEILDGHWDLPIKEVDLDGR